MSRINVANFRHPDGTSDNISLTDTGRVGINTSSPSAFLHVQNGEIVKDQDSSQSSANPGFQIKHNGTINGSWRHDGRLEIGGQDANANVRLDTDGIKFNGDTATANALDDYEEGTWTPTVTTGTVNVSNAVYTKIGRMVTCTANISTFSNRTSSNVIYVNNLPFTPAANVVVGVCTARYYAGPDVIAQVQTNGNMFFTRIANTANFDTATHNDLSDSNSMIYFVATYSAA